MTVPLDTVFFDAAGTLFHVRETVGALYQRESGGGEQESSEAEVTRLDLAFRDVLEGRPPLLFPDASDEQLPALERQWWQDAVQETFRRAGLAPVSVRQFHRIYDHYATAAAWKLEPGCREVLEELRRRRCRLGVISNFDTRLPSILADLGIRDFFDVVTVSSLVRAAKPDRAIFRSALEKLKAVPGQAIHVGDTPLDDVTGARNAGLSAVLYDPHELHGAHTGPRIADLREVLAFLV